MGCVHTNVKSRTFEVEVACYQYTTYEEKCNLHKRWLLECIEHRHLRLLSSTPTIEEVKKSAVDLHNIIYNYTNITHDYQYSTDYSPSIQSERYGEYNVEYCQSHITCYGYGIMLSNRWQFECTEHGISNNTHTMSTIEQCFKKNLNIGSRSRRFFEVAYG